VRDGLDIDSPRMGPGLGVEECDHDITPGDWDKPLKLWGTFWQWPHTKPSPTNKQTKSVTVKLVKVVF
jgi:hypothetical protein